MTIDSLIGKYKKKLEHITNLKNKTSFELVRVSCLEKEFIVREMIKDLEELRESCKEAFNNRIHFVELQQEYLNRKIIGIDK